MGAKTVAKATVVVHLFSTRTTSGSNMVSLASVRAARKPATLEFTLAWRPTLTGSSKQWRINK